ncbi:MAG: metallophosphoesterase [Bacteroidales bacterium]|nr:metallophosphoesterase [Bacteroidales bacterium]
MKKIISFIILVTISLSIYAQYNFEKKPYILFQNKESEDPNINYTPELKDIMIRWQLDEENTNDACTIWWGINSYTNSATAEKDDLYDKLYYYNLSIDQSASQPLDPLTKYEYKVIIENGEEAFGTFITPPLPDATELTFYAYGDTRSNPGTNNEVCGKIVAEIDDNSQTFLLHSGDWIDHDTEEYWQDEYFNLQSNMSIQLRLMISTMGVLGNHEANGYGQGAIYKKYWTYSYENSFYYSFDYGPVHICCLEITNDDPIDPGQISWLIEKDLLYTDKKWKILMFHTPGYSNGGHPNNEQVQNIIQPICEEFGVQIVIAGHNHYYAHWLVNGVHHLTLGGGGAPLYDPEPGGLKAYRFYHFAKFDIENEMMNITIHHKNDDGNWGNDFDTFSLPPTLKICNGTQETWVEDITYVDEIRVCEGSTLTITSEVGFIEDGKIIVEAGGKLELNGCKLTSVNNDETWYGIEVWGDPTAGQNPIDQGWVLLQNGATIENSEQGIVASLLEEDPTEGDLIPNPAYAGGIIQANGANFINNQTAVQFYDYPHSSVSWFVDCEFKVDGNYFGTQEPENYMVIDNMRGVDITNCDFINATTTKQYTGILSENSTISLEGVCISGSPCTAWDYGLFENLDYGIYATATTSTRYVDIRHTTFTNNYRGLYIGGMKSPRITSNEFYLDVQAVNEGYGLYLDESTDFWVEDNIFEKCNGCSGQTGVGVIVNDAGRDPNEIYLNVFNDVEYAINTQGKNRNGKSPEEGLMIKCNDYNNTLYDETILWEFSPFISGDEGIAGDQGVNTLNIEDMAGNIFYYNTTTTDDYDDLNNESNHFDYYYSTNTDDPYVEPDDFTDNTVDKVGKFTSDEWTYEEACESNINTGGGVEDERGKMNAAQSDIETTEAILNAIIDGGDTEALNTEVETSTPPETVEVYNELMGESPNLSETVVESTIEQETVLPNAMVRDVMVANPHTAKSQVLLDVLDERFDPMPEYMKAQILAGRSIQTLKQELESKLAGYRLQKAKAMNAIIRYYREELEDPTAASDSLLALFQSDNTLKSSYSLAWLYLERGEYQQGVNVMSNIPNQFTLTEDEQQDYTNMDGIYTMLSGLYENGNTIECLNEGQLAELQTLASGETGSSRAYARNILIALSELEYDEPILHPDFLKSSMAIEDYNKLLKTEAPQLLEVYPNPSSGFVIFEYKMNTETKGFIEIKDVAGKTISTITTTGKQDQVTLLTENWQTGVYIANLTVNGKSIESVKFTIVK